MYIHIYLHWIAIAGGRAKELVEFLDARRSADDLAANLKAQRDRKCGPPNLHGTKKGAAIKYIILSNINGMTISTNKTIIMQMFYICI